MKHPTGIQATTDDRESLDYSHRRRKRYRRTRIATYLLGLYLILAYLLIPLVWEWIERRNLANDDRPQVTSTSDGHPGDPINVRLVGNQAELVHVMELAGWYQADKLGLKSDLAIGADTLLDRTYDNAPVSRLYLFGRAEDLAFEQPIKTKPRQRHHVRFWKSDQLNQEGRNVWFGAASFDERVGFSHTTGQITHHISTDVDAERNYLAETLKQTNELASEQLEQGFHDQLQGFNGGGDPWKTDGAIWTATIRDASQPNKVSHNCPNCSNSGSTSDCSYDWDNRATMKHPTPQSFVDKVQAECRTIVPIVAPPVAAPVAATDWDNRATMKHNVDSAKVIF